MATTGLSKGPWTEEEDKILIAYIEKHGEKVPWLEVQQHSGLSRCGKSCRFRWMNHLRPNLKKGTLTDQEQQRVIELHALLGNKWAKMVQDKQLRGRTDNEIKNFWNSRRKRQQRLGLPVCPEEVREKVMNAAIQSGRQDSLQADCVEISEVEFKHLPPYYQSIPGNVPTTGVVVRQRPSFSQHNMYNLTTAASPYMPNRKRSREPETAFPCTGGYAMDPLLWGYPLLGDATYTYSPLPPLVPDIDLVETLELPSFQNITSHEEPGSWGAQHEFNPMQEHHEPDNTLVQTSPCYDGLLESVVFGSSGEKRATYTDHSESPVLLQSSLLDDEPDNTLVQTSPCYDGLLESVVFGSSGEKRATYTDHSESPLLQSSLLGSTELTPTNQNITSHEEPGSQHEFNPMPEHDDEPDNTLVQTSPCYDGLLESIDFGSSGDQKQATYTTDHSESPLLHGNTELTPANQNTTGSTSSNETSFEDDWISDLIRELLGEDETMQVEEVFRRYILD